MNSVPGLVKEQKNKSETFASSLYQEIETMSKWVFRLQKTYVWPENETWCYRSLFLKWLVCNKMPLENHSKNDAEEIPGF